MNNTSNQSAKASKAKKFNMKAVSGSHANNTSLVGSAIDVSNTTITTSNNGIVFKNCTSTKVGQPQIATGNLVGSMPQGSTMITPKVQHLIGSTTTKANSSVGPQPHPQFR